mgnify:CR=1 FL=1
MNSRASGNAVRVAASLPQRRVIFVPDRNLGDYVGRRLPDKELVLWPGRCPVHARVRPADAETLRARHPEAAMLVHPECDPAVVASADFVGSTAEIINYAAKAAGREFIIGTEAGVLHKLGRARPDARFYLLHPDMVCPDMKKITLAGVYAALATMQPAVTVEEGLARRARAALDRMLELV